MISRKSHYSRQIIFCAIAVLFTALTVCADESWQTNYAALGKLIVTPFISAPFPHPARADGHKYHDEFYPAKEHYADSTVVIFIPNHFRATDQVDFVVHFHGWNNTVAGTLEQFKLIEQFCDSGKNAILIVPEGPHNAPDSFGGKLEDTNGFKIFMDEAMEKLRANGVLTNSNPEIGNIILSGHSGGYHVMAAILDHGGLPDKIKEVWLFDALYGGTENFVAWQKNEKGRLLDIYTDHGGTKDETEKLMAYYLSSLRLGLTTESIGFFVAEETNTIPQNLLTNKIVFLHTDLMHNEVVFRRDEFAQFLKTSCLPDMASSFVYIRGEFKHRGPIAWTNGMTLKEAIDIGVFTAFSRPEIILVHTDGSREQYKWTVDQPLTNNPILKIGDEVICPWIE